MAVVLVLSAPFLSAVHPYHVSITTIDHNPETGSYEITCKMFRDDIEEALEAQGTGRMYLGATDEHKDANRLLFRYLQNNFSIESDGELVEYNWIGKEVEFEAVWLYVECTNAPDPAKLKISNSLLIEHLQDQENRIHFNKGKETKSVYLNKDQTTGWIEF